MMQVTLCLFFLLTHFMGGLEPFKEGAFLGGNLGLEHQASLECGDQGVQFSCGSVFNTSTLLG